MNNSHDPIEMRPTLEPTFEGKRAVAESHAALLKNFASDVVDRRAATLKEGARSHVDDDIKEFSPEVIARLVRKSSTTA